MRKRACVLMILDEPTKTTTEIEEEPIEFTEPPEIEEWDTIDDLPF